MEQIIANKFFFWANGRPFQSLNKAKRYAQDTEANEVVITRGEREEILYQYHPMTERLERVQTIAQAKAKLTK